MDLKALQFPHDCIGMAQSLIFIFDYEKGIWEKYIVCIYFEQLIMN